MTTSHTNCDHEATKAARAQCRKDRAALAAKAAELVAYFDAHAEGDRHNWLAYAARRFCDFEGDTTDRQAMALHIITHPRKQDTEYNRRNGYTPYTTPAALWHMTLRAAS